MVLLRQSEDRVFDLATFRFGWLLAGFGVPVEDFEAQEMEVL